MKFARCDRSRLLSLCTEQKVPTQAICYIPVVTPCQRRVSGKTPSLPVYEIEDNRHIPARLFVRLMLDNYLPRRTRMKYVLLIYHGPNPTLPGSDRWNALPPAEQKAIYAD